MRDKYPVAEPEFTDTEDILSTSGTIEMRRSRRSVPGDNHMRDTAQFLGRARKPGRSASISASWMRRMVAERVMSDSGPPLVDGNTISDPPSLGRSFKSATAAAERGTRCSRPFSFAGRERLIGRRPDQSRPIPPRALPRIGWRSARQTPKPARQSLPAPSGR